MKGNLMTIIGIIALGIIIIWWYNNRALFVNGIDTSNNITTPMGTFSISPDGTECFSIGTTGGVANMKVPMCNCDKTCV